MTPEVGTDFRKGSCARSEALQRPLRVQGTRGAVVPPATGEKCLEAAVLGGRGQGILRRGLAEQRFLDRLLQRGRQFLVFRRGRTRIHGGKTLLGGGDQLFLALGDGR